MKIQVLGFAIGILTSSCGNESYDNRTTPTQVVKEKKEKGSTELFDGKVDIIPLSQTPWESRCTAVENFVAKFSRAYLKDVSIEVIEPCRQQPMEALVYYTYQVSLIRENASIQLQFLYDSKTTKNSGYIKRRFEIGGEAYRYEESDSNIGEGLKVLNDRYQEWLEGDNTEATIYGKTLTVFSHGIIDDLESGKTIIADPVLEVKATPSEESILKGEFQYMKIDPAYYSTGTYLGCALADGLDCVNTNLEYQLIGQFIIVKRFAEEANQSYGTYFELSE